MIDEGILVLALIGGIFLYVVVGGFIGKLCGSLSAYINYKKKDDDEDGWRYMGILFMPFMTVMLIALCLLSLVSIPFRLYKVEKKLRLLK